MPLPMPHAGMDEKDWMNECMGSEAMRHEFPDMKRRAGVCHSQYRRLGKKAKRKAPPPPRRKGG